MTYFLVLGTKYERRDFKGFSVHQHSSLKNTQCMMMSLVECYKTVPGDIFGAIDYWLNRLVNILTLKLFLSYYNPDTIKRFDSDVHMVLAVNKTKKKWSKLNLCWSIFLKEVVMRIFQGLFSWLSKQNSRHNYNLIMICKVQYHQEK